jgi:hypothetical protein
VVDVFGSGNVVDRRDLGGAVAVGLLWPVDPERRRP